MFGRNNGANANSNRPPASEVARIQGTLTQVLVGGDSTADIAVFINGQPVPTGELESLSIEIIAPDDRSPQGSLSGVLSRYQTGPAGAREPHASALFPGTVELIARGRRVIVTCRQEGSFDGLWLGLGLRDDGTSSELSGVQSLRLAVASGLVDAKLVWSEDGVTEDLLPG